MPEFSQPDGPICAEAYLKPQFAFYQEDFNGHSERPPDELQFVAATFTDTHTRMWTMAEARADGIIEADTTGDATIEHFFLEGPDGKEVLFELQKQKDAIIGRRIVIFWTAEFEACTEYSLYPQAENIVRREDNNWLLALGVASREESIAAKAKAEAYERERGFNFQPIGAREVAELHGYIGRCE